MTVVPHKIERRRKLLPLLAILVTATVYLLSTANRAVTDYDEAYYAQVAMRMVQHNDWITPYANDVRFLEKPPFLYWMTALSFKVFGISEFSLRLPTALAVIAIVWIVILTVRLAADENAVFIAGLSMAFSMGTYLFTRETLHDIWLVLFLALAVFAFFRWYLDPPHSRGFALLFYFSMAGALMCKGLVGIAFPLGIAVLFFLFSREFPKRSTLQLLPGILLFLFLTVPWHWLAAIQNEGFLRFYFIDEQFLRFLGKREPPVLWSVPFAAFWALILVWFFPWTAFLPAAFSMRPKRLDGRERDLFKLAIIWAAVVLVFFSFTERLEHYAFPAIPALSILVSIALGPCRRSLSILWAFRSLAILGILILAFGIGVGIWVASGNVIHFKPTGTPDRLAEADFSIMADIPPAMALDLLKPAAATALSLGIGFLIALWFETRGRRLNAVMSLVAVMAVVFAMTHWSFNICEDLISSKKFALAVGRIAAPEDRLILMDDYESANSLSFYQPLQVEIHDGQAYALVPGMRFPDAPNIVLSQEEFRAAWRSGSRIFLIGPIGRIETLDLDYRERLRVLHRTLVSNY